MVRTIKLNHELPVLSRNYYPAQPNFDPSLGTAKGGRTAWRLQAWSLTLTFAASTLAGTVEATPTELTRIYFYVAHRRELVPSIDSTSDRTSSPYVIA